MTASSSREIGPLGSVSRVAGGAAAFVLPLLVWGSTWWDWVAGLVGFPLLATAAGATFAALDPSRAFADPATRSARSAGGLTLVASVLAGATALTYVTAVDGTAVWIFVGASMLLAAAKGYGGCEVLAFPSVLTGSRYEAGCLLYGPIDTAEARWRKPPRPSET